MNHALFVSGCAALVLSSAAGSALAQCDFDGNKSKGAKLQFVRAAAACPSITFAAPNSQTGSGVPTCANPYQHSSYQFASSKSGCKVSLNPKLEEPCSNGDPAACTNVLIQASCNGIVESDGVTEIDEAGWALAMAWRMTFDDPDNGDMTTINYPFLVAFPPASRGKLSVKTDTNYLFTSLGLGSLPGCTSIEFVTAAIQDPGGNPFAKEGIAARP